MKGTCRNLCNMLEHVSYYGHIERYSRHKDWKRCFACYKLIKSDKRNCPCCGGPFKFICRTGIHEFDTEEELKQHNMKSRFRREKP